MYYKKQCGTSKLKTCTIAISQMKLTPETLSVGIPANR